MISYTWLPFHLFSSFHKCSLVYKNMVGLVLLIFGNKISLSHESVNKLIKSYWHDKILNKILFNHIQLAFHPFYIIWHYNHYIIHWHVWAFFYDLLLSESTLIFLGLIRVIILTFLSSLLCHRFTMKKSISAVFIQE